MRFCSKPYCDREDAGQGLCREHALKLKGKPRVWKVRRGAQRGWWARACDTSGNPMSAYQRGPFLEWHLALRWALNRRYGSLAA
jgi:hypothetical protein